MIRPLILLFLLLTTVVVNGDATPSSQHLSIPVLNPSFENDALTPSMVTPPSDWTPDAPFLRPIVVGFVVANHGYEIAPDGTRFLQVQNGHTEYQTIPASTYTPLAGDIVVATVALGPQAKSYLGDVALTLDGTIVAKNSASTTVTPTYPNFADATVTYIVQAQDIHKSLGIALIDASTGQFPTTESRSFDHVRLDVTRGAPSTEQAAHAAENAFTAPPPSVRKGYRVFSVGHSYHFLNYDFPELLREIARAGGFPDHEIVGIDVIFGSKVIQHWDAAEDEDGPKREHVVKAALRAGAVDVLTLVGLFLPDPGIENFTKLAFEHNSNVRVTVQEIWLPWDANQVHYWDPPLVPRPATVDHNAATFEGLEAIHQPYFQAMDNLVTGINQRLGKQVLFVVPVGQAVLALRGKVIAGQVPGVKTQEELFADPLGHPKAVIQALTAYCHYAVIYKRNPLGLPVPSVLKQSTIPPEDLDALNRLLQQLAWDAVIHHPLSGVTASD